MADLSQQEKQDLIRQALAARKFAIAPYSHFTVGAALRAKNGKVYTGCNIENAAFTPTTCAERTALFKAVSEGVTEFTDIAIVGARIGEVNTLVTAPCGVCRQALYEFTGPALHVILAKTPEDYQEMTLGELLPLGFGPKNVL
ncbi:MAG: cytidine deaminase [Faecalibacterium sp.]|jgi:cytidine deaminase|nr:cytidine deaminase [Faecalibacterium sp.]